MVRLHKKAFDLHIIPSKMSAERLREEDRKLRLLEQMRNQIAQSSSSLHPLEEMLDSVQALVEERHQSRINARNPLLGRVGD